MICRGCCGYRQISVCVGRGLQVRIHEDEVAEVLRQLVFGTLTWDAVVAKYPAQQAAAEDDP